MDILRVADPALHHDLERRIVLGAPSLRDGSLAQATFVGYGSSFCLPTSRLDSRGLAVSATSVA